MSGGSLDYAYFKIEMLADELQNVIDKQGQPSGYMAEKHYTYPDEVVVEFVEIIAKARQLAKLAKEAEWRISGDTGDDTFMARVNRIKAES